MERRVKKQMIYSIMKNFLKIIGIVLITTCVSAATTFFVVRSVKPSVLIGHSIIVCD